MIVGYKTYFFSFLKLLIEANVIKIVILNNKLGGKKSSWYLKLIFIII